MKIKNYYDYYGELANTSGSYTELTGRYAIQEASERLIVPDIINKLSIKPKDVLLEIGCGPGNLLIPLSFYVDAAFGIDHPNVIEKLKVRFTDEKLNLIGDDFFKHIFNQKFDKILCYGVVPALPNEGLVYSILDKAMDLLKPSGKLLLGDLNNIDKKSRFLNSARGMKFQEDWNSKMVHVKETDIETPADHKLVVDDKLVMGLIEHIRKKGMHGYIYDQPQDLPFGNSREDIVVVGPEYSDN